MKILFLTRSLNSGGAERQLVNLAKGLRQSGHQVAVMVFYANGFLETELRGANVHVLDLGKSGRWDVMFFLGRLIRTIRELRPEIVYGFLGTSNILAVLLKVFSPSLTVVWGIRASNVDLDLYDWFARASYRLERWLSRFADQIICNSYAGLEYAAANGFPKAKMTCIPNGIDTGQFRYDAAGRDAIRCEWNVGKNEMLVGTVARLDPMKGHKMLLKSIALLSTLRSDLRFVCVGDGPNGYSEELRRLGMNMGLEKILVWAGQRNDMAGVYGALDLLVLPSVSGEGFSNALGEAMACGLVCVATDVGDAAKIVGETGIIVPPNDPVALMNGIVTALGTPRVRDSITHACRVRIVGRFTVSRMVRETEAVLGRCRQT